MFTGIIEAVGTIVSAAVGPRMTTIEVGASALASSCAPGDSVSVSGVCLTVISASGGNLRFQVGGETLQRTTLGGKRPGEAVNLERAMVAGGRFGGHFVTGHVDGVCQVTSIDRRQGQSTVWVTVPDELAAYVIARGSVALDGVSLTVAAREGPRFSVALVPFTVEHTTLGAWRVGHRVNVETDMIVKAVFSYMSLPAGKTGDSAIIDMDFLRKLGFA